MPKGPFTLAIFAVISSAISRRFQIARVKSAIAAESPVVYTGDFKSP